MDLIPDFIKRRHGEVKIEYEHPLLEAISRRPYGVLIYQEQVMQAAQILAGYTLGGADLLRRAMGKKKIEEMRSSARRSSKAAGRRTTSPAQGQPGVRSAGKIRRLRFQQIARRRLRHRRVSDRVSEGQLPGRVPQRDDDERHELDGQTDHCPERGTRDGVEVLPPDVNEGQAFFWPAKSRAGVSPAPTDPVTHEGSTTDDDTEKGGETPALH
jgi:DNA polymerase-3 subunit alpha